MWKNKEKFAKAIRQADAKIKRILQRREQRRSGAGRRLLQDDTIMVDYVEYEVTFNGTDEAYVNEATEIALEDNGDGIIQEFNDLVAADPELDEEPIDIAEVEDTIDGEFELEIIDPSEGVIANSTATESSIFMIPLGIYQVDIKMESASGNALSFTLNGAPKTDIIINIGDSDVSIEYEGELIASVGNTDSFSHGSLLNVGTLGLGYKGVFIEYHEMCPIGYTNVHSDFDPVLLPESSLYLTNGVPDLKIDFMLPNYYYDITATYGAEQCSGASGNVLVSSDPMGCNTVHKTSVNHQDDCSFDLTDQGDGSYIYQGQLTINAKLNIDLNGYAITRTVQSPLSWQVELANEISVTSDVEVKEDALCYSNNDCTNDQGCCEDGLCNCDCGTSAKTGYAGDLCENDVTAPVCDSGCVTHTLQSYHGGSLNAFDRGLYDLPVFSDNSGDAVTVVSIQIDGVDVNDQEYSFPIGSTTVTYVVKDDDDNEATFTYTIVVEDKRAPEVDCNECQADAVADSLNVCRGTASGWEKVSLSAIDYESLVGDPSIKSRGAVNPSYLPGQDIENTDTYAGQLAVSAGHLDCDCNYLVGGDVKFSQSSVKLDGSSHVLVPPNDAYGFGTGDFTIVQWFKATNLNADTYQNLWDFRSTNIMESIPTMWIGRTTNYAYYYWAGGAVLNYNTVPTEDVWYLSAVVRENGVIRVYQNDVEVASGSRTTNYAAPQHGIYIGRRADTSQPYHLHGNVDDFALWNTALSASQIESIYNDGNPIDLSSLNPLTYLKMGDGDSGTTITDHGSLGNHASLVGNAVFDSDTSGTGSPSNDITYPYTQIVTNSWESWPSPSSHDIEDGSINVAGVTDPNADGEYNVQYTATDAAGNQGTCTKRGIIYDITDPSCENDFYAAPIIDVNDKNYSVAVPYDEAIFNPSYGISGVGSAAYLDPARNDGDAYHVGYARDISYTSTYHLEDGAGNTATCSWEVFVDNPNPCVYPTCDDEPPTVENCPTSYQFECNENENCGCGKWTPPTFKDDKFVKDIKVYIDGVLFETYDNTGTDETGTSHAPHHLLKLGASNITYVAQDMHGKTARCQFEVTIVDNVKPDFSTCPESETIYTGTISADYTYSVEAADSCVVNQNVAYGTVGYPANANDITDVTVNLPLGDKAFHFTATDDSGNKKDCQFTISVVDNVDPTITCPANIVDRLDQGTNSKVQTFTVTAHDTGANSNPSIVLSHESGSAFPEGITTVIAVATDDAGNTATCSFEVQHELGYPFATFEAALVSASVNEDGGYGANLEIYSFTNVYHRVSSVVSADNLAVSNIAPTSCAEDAAVCQQNWGLRVTFDQCKVENSSYDFTANVACLPTDCSEAKSFDFTVILDVANFCWQDLESVSISASLGTTSKANHDVYMIAYDADPSVGYTSVTAFDNGADISGIISVTSDQVELSNVDIVSASRQHYSDADRTVAEGSAKDVLENEVNKATVASFTYQENDVALESTYYTTYTATVEVSYNFGGARRRMLLSTDDTEASTQKIVTAETVSFGTSETIINPEDAVVVLKLNQCSNDDSLVQGLTDVIAQALRIDSARVNVLVSESTCFVQVSISQLDCDVSDINDILSLFETAITDPFHDIHTIMYQNDDISMDITFDYGTFFVSQSPVVNNSQAALFSSSSNNDSSSSLDWYVYAAVGIVAGALVASVIKSRKQ